MALRRRLEAMVQVPALAQQAAGGGRSAAVQSLALEARVKDEPELAARVAVGWSSLGENERALALMRTAVARAPAKTASMRLELASALLQADDAGVGELLRGLERDPTLGGPERRWLGDFRVRARRPRRRPGRGGRAARHRAGRARPGAARVPGRFRPLQAALGRALERRGDAGAARAAFGRALAVRPDDLEARRGAVDTALAEGDVAAARRLVEEGFAASRASRWRTCSPHGWRSPRWTTGR